MRSGIRGAVVAAAVLAAVAAGCGGSGGEDAAASRDDAREQFRAAAVDYAQCMREHGIDMPDPQPGRPGIMLGGPNGPSPDDPGFEEAERECRPILEKVEPPELSDEQEQEMREAGLAFARCMREHGIDMPDPQFDEGRVRMRVGGSGTGFDPSDPAFQEAQESCRDELPERRFGPGPR